MCFGRRLVGERRSAGLVLVVMREQPAHLGFDPGFGAFVDRFGLFARQLQHGGQHAGVRALATGQRTEDHAHDVRDLTHELTRLLRRLGGRKFQHHGQVVGQLVRSQKQARFFVGLDQVDHGRAAVARIAVHVLEQVQRGAATTVEQLDVLGLDVQRRLGGQVPEQRVELGQPGGRQSRLGAQRLLQLGGVGAERRVGVTQQVRQHAQREPRLRRG